MARTAPHVVSLPDRRNSGQGPKAKTSAAIAQSDKKAALTDAQKKDLAKKKREQKRAAYPITVVTTKLHKGAQNRDLLDVMFQAATEWAAENSYVISQTDPETRKNGNVAIEMIVDTPESFAERSTTRGEAKQSREIANAISTALRSESVKAKAIELNVTPKDLVMDALSKQFGIKLEVA